MKHISSFEDLSIRIQEERQDEIARLCRDINKMLERLENENVRHQEMDRRLIMNEKLVATGRLAANIAHEINNPLFAISNALAVIKKQTRDKSSDVAELLPLAEKEIKRVRKITRKLLDYGKINLETFQESDVNSILTTACEVLKLSKGSKNTMVTRNNKSAILPIRCNPDSIQQVFMNLILNASEAMNGRGEIVIDIQVTGNGYEIHFRDSGPGFPAEIKKRIFEPFNSSKATKGAGLGLYIAYHIIKRHGGGMTLGEMHGAGADLIITLPRGGATHE
jgi:signal transduction histidine kinase